MRVVLATVGTRGDVQPMVAVARALATHGHEALVACPGAFASWVGSHGVAHADFGEDVQAMAASAGPAPERTIRAMRQHFTEEMERQVPRLLALAQGADAIVFTGMAWMAPSVAEKLGIPALGLLPSTAALPTRQHPPPLMPWFGLPGPVNDALWWLYERTTRGLMGEPVDRGRATLGLPPSRAFDQHLFVDTPCVLAVDAELMPPDPAWGGRYPYTGFVFLDDPRPLAPELSAWLDAGEPPIFVGFGSMSGGENARVGALVRGLREVSSARVLVLGDRDALFGGEVPRGTFVVREAPFPALFPRVAMVVHHGGSGTMALALRAGVPQVVLPVMLDQHHHRAYLQRAGLAPPSTTLAKATVPSLARAIELGLALPAETRRAYATRIGASRGADAVVRRLEAFRA